MASLRTGIVIAWMLSASLCWGQTYQARSTQPVTRYATGTYQTAQAYSPSQYATYPTDVICLTCEDCQPQSSSQPPFPIEWLSVEADRLDINRVQVDWTVWQQNSRGLYTVERRLAPEDAFQAVGQVARSQDGMLFLSYVDSNSFLGNSYYRIRQVDYDGQEAISAVQVVSGGAHAFQPTLYPNPWHDDLHIRWPAEDMEPFTAGLTLYDWQGREVHQQVLSIRPASHTTLHLPELSAGVYVLSLKGSSWQWQEMLQKRP